jgi:hypothetical protein
MKKHNFRIFGIFFIGVMLLYGIVDIVTKILFKNINNLQYTWIMFITIFFFYFGIFYRNLESFIRKILVKNSKNWQK